MGSPPLDAPGTAEPLRPRRVLVAAAAVLALTCLPLLTGWWRTPPGQEFRWARGLNSSDFLASQAMILRAAAGEHPVRSSYCSTPERSGGLWRPTYELLGVAVGALGVSPVLAFHLGRLAAGLLFLQALYRLAALVWPTERQRWQAWTLCALGSGLSWLAWALHPAHPPSAWADSIQAEATAFSMLQEGPHMVVGHWLLIEVALGLLLALRASEPAAVRRGALRASLAAALALLDQPYLGPPLVLLVGLGLILARGPAVPPVSAAAVAALVGLGALLSAQDVLWRLAIEPRYAAWNEGTGSFPPGVFLLGNAPLWLLALLGAAEWRGPPWARRLLVAWALGYWALVYLPLPNQRRFCEGWTLPLALLAAAGLDALRARWPRRATVPLALGLACAGSLHLQVMQVRAQASGELYRPQALGEALRSLRARLSPGDLVLADWDTSEELAAVAGCRVVHGHLHQGRAEPPLLQAAAAELRRAAGEGRAPRFGGELAGVTWVAAVRRSDGALRVVLDDARGEVLWEGPAAWGPPLLAGEALALLPLPGPPS